MARRTTAVRICACQSQCLEKCLCFNICSCGKRNPIIPLTRMSYRLLQKYDLFHYLIIQHANLCFVKQWSSLFFM